MRGSFTDSVCFSLLLVGLWFSRHSHCLCGVGHDLTPATNVCVYERACMCVDTYLNVIFERVCVWMCGASGGLPARV